MGGYQYGSNDHSHAYADSLGDMDHSQMINQGYHNELHELEMSQSTLQKLRNHHMEADQVSNNQLIDKCELTNEEKYFLDRAYPNEEPLLSYN